MVKTLMKLLLVLLAIGFAALVSYAHFADMSPEQAPVNAATTLQVR